MIDIINLEVTTACPFRCPQCYCGLENPKHMDISKAEFWISEAEKNGCKSVSISGGETILYPHLFELVRYIHDKKMDCAAAFSGYAFTESICDNLIDSGLDAIHISLNGSTKKINQITREGYEYSINAIRLLKDYDRCQRVINWVMTKNNSNDFDNILKIAEDFQFDCIQIIGYKPAFKNQIAFLPTYSQMSKIVEIIRNYKGNVRVVVESCFSSLRALLYDYGFWGNFNNGKAKGCIAGNGAISISVDGRLSPCRHIDIRESYDTIKDYLDNSFAIKSIKEASKNVLKPCLECKYKANCLHCIAVNYSLDKRLTFGDPFCPISSEI